MVIQSTKVKRVQIWLSVDERRSLAQFEPILGRANEISPPDETKHNGGVTGNERRVTWAKVEVKFKQTLSSLFGRFSKNCMSILKIP